MALEYKTLAAELKAATGKPDGSYQGYFGATNNVDDGLDIIESGAYTKTLQERAQRIKVFLGHDWSKLVGPAPDVIHEDSKGLYVEGRLTLGSFWGKETWELLKDNALNEGSIGFETVAGKIEWLENGIRRIKELKLYEISFVPLGMNPQTAIAAVKSLLSRDPGAGLEELKRYLAELKAGARHSRTDSEAINMIASLAVDLGATNVKLLDVAGEDPAPEPEPAKSRAASALTLRARQQAAELALATKPN